jgi:hypothetical protein
VLETSSPELVLELSLLVVLEPASSLEGVLGPSSKELVVLESPWEVVVPE